MMVLDIRCSLNIIVTALLFLISIIFLHSLLPYNNEISASHHRVCHIHVHSLSLIIANASFSQYPHFYHLHSLLRIDGKLSFKWLCSCYHSLAFILLIFCHVLVHPFPIHFVIPLSVPFVSMLSTLLSQLFYHCFTS